MFSPKKLSPLKTTTALLCAAGVGAALAFTTPTIAQDTAAAAKVYQVDTIHSAVIFKAKHMGAGYSYGRFNDFKGTITVDPADVSKSSVTIEIAAKSIDTANAKRDQHLTSPDFFNAAEFPTITYKSTSVKEAGNGKYEVTGNLTLLGQTKPVTAQFVKVGEGKNRQGKTLVGYEATFSFKRSDFGMNFMLEGLSDQIDVIVALEAVEQ